MSPPPSPRAYRRFEAAQLPRATAWRFAYLISQGGLSLTLFGLLAHILPTPQFAAAAIAQAVLVIAQSVGDFGLSQAAVTALPALMARRPAEERALLRGAASLYRWSALVALGLALLAVLVVPAPARAGVALIAPAAAVTVLVSGADGLLRARGEFALPALLVTVSRLGAFAGIATAAATGTAVGACAGIAAGTVVCSIPAVAVIVRALAGSRQGECSDLIKAALPLGCAQLFIAASGRLDTVLLSALSGAVVGGGFESAWRVYQLSQYVVGGLASAAAPFISDALGAGRRAEAGAIIRRVGATALAAGLVLAAATLAFAGPLSRFLFGGLGASVARALPPLALVTPITFLATLATTILAISPRTRWWILPACALGAVVNVTLILTLARHGSLREATIACAVGLLATSAVLIGRLLSVATELRSVVVEAPVIPLPVSRTG